MGPCLRRDDGVGEATQRFNAHSQRDARDYTGCNGRCGPSGKMTSIASPARTSPPASTTLITPALRIRLPLASLSSVAAINPFWIEEPTHPDDVLAHKTLADAIAPVKLALGEHVPNRVIFKNYLQTGSAGFIQVDAVRVAGVSEFLAVSLLSRKFGIPVVPHVGDMGQLHQHLVLFNHIGMGHEALFLEHIPHLREHFVHPVRVEGGVYRTPEEPGSGCDLK